MEFGKELSLQNKKSFNLQNNAKLLKNYYLLLTINYLLINT